MIIYIISFIASMSVYDAQYINYYTGLSPRIIEATGMLYGANEANYTQSRHEILLGFHITFIYQYLSLFSVFSYIFLLLTYITFVFFLIKGQHHICIYQ
jgi:hypothetical protein